MLPDRLVQPPRGGRLPWACSHEAHWGRRRSIPEAPGAEQHADL